MIKIIKTFTIFFLLIIMISCKYKNENTTKFNSFKKIYKLKGISPRKENNDVPSSMIVGMTDSLIILNDVSNNKSCLHIFTRQRLDYLLSSGKIGKGPKEITRAGIAFLNFKKTAIYVMDIGKYKLFKFNLNQLLKKRKEYKPIIVASIPKSFMPITQIQHY